MSTTIPLNPKIEAILSGFDFDQVQRVMAHLNWRWTEPSGSLSVPTVEWLRETARDHLQYVAGKGSSRYISSGGLVARRGDDGYLSLSFEAVQAGGYL